MTPSIGGRRSVRHAFAGLSLGVALGIGGCAGGSGSSSPVATTQVDLPASYRFVPPDIGLAAGATVTWTNHDNFTHSVAFLDGGLPTDPMVMKPGETVTFTFPAPGTYRYQCSFHPQNMKGSIVVAAP